MIRSTHLRLLVLVGLLGAVAALVACGDGVEPTAPTPASNNQTSASCSAQGNGNTVICAPATPTPTPATAAACIAQTGPFTCAKASPQFQAILQSAQAKVLDAPEPIYVANLVKALNEHLGADGKPDICATSGFPLPSDEIAVKARVSNAISETWDVVNANGTPQSIYVTACNPSRF